MGIATREHKRPGASEARESGSVAGGTDWTSRPEPSPAWWLSAGTLNTTICESLAFLASHQNRRLLAGMLGLRPAAGDTVQGRLEARRVAGGEQLLGVGPRPVTPTELRGHAEVQLESAVGAAHVAVAATRDRGFGRVENPDLLHVCPP